MSGFYLDKVVTTTAAILYGKQHENEAILSYEKSQQVAIEVNKCGLIFDSWLGASPEGIALTPHRKST